MTVSVSDLVSWLEYQAKLSGGDPVVKVQGRDGDSVPIDMQEVEYLFRYDPKTLCLMITLD